MYVMYVVRMNACKYVNVCIHACMHVCMYVMYVCNVCMHMYVCMHVRKCGVEAVAAALSLEGSGA